MAEEFKFKGKNNPKIKSTLDGTVLKYYLNKDDLSDYELSVNFINGVKTAVRKDPRYNNYKSHLYSIGLDRCQVHSGITAEMAPIEEHHGPIFDLFTVCLIVTDHMLNEGEEITTMMVANKVLEAHEKHWIQVVMLCETCHEAAENDAHFLPFEMGFGQIDKFITKFKRGFQDEQYNLIKEYLQESKKHGYVDNGIHKIMDKVKKYVKEND
jgi:hypothetical protein